MHIIGSVSQQFCWSVKFTKKFWDSFKFIATFHDHFCHFLCLSWFVWEKTNPLPCGQLFGNHVVFKFAPPM